MHGQQVRLRKRPLLVTRFARASARKAAPYWARLFLILLVAALTCPQSAAAAVRNFTITGFTKVRIEGPYRVKITTDVPPFAKAEGSPNALDRVAIEVRGDTLVVRSDPNGWGGYPGTDPGPVV